VQVQQIVPSSLGTIMLRCLMLMITGWEPHLVSRFCPEIVSAHNQMPAGSRQPGAENSQRNNQDTHPSKYVLPCGAASSWLPLATLGAAAPAVLWWALQQPSPSRGPSHRSRYICKATLAVSDMCMHMHTNSQGNDMSRGPSMMDPACHACSVQSTQEATTLLRILDAMQ
jgi:hypothetical protein